MQHFRPTGPRLFPHLPRTFIPLLDRRTHTRRRRGPALYTRIAVGSVGSSLPDSHWFFPGVPALRSQRAPSRSLAIIPRLPAPHTRDHLRWRCATLLLLPTLCHITTTCKRTPGFPHAFHLPATPHRPPPSDGYHLLLTGYSCISRLFYCCCFAHCPDTPLPFRCCLPHSFFLSLSWVRCGSICPTCVAIQRHVV